MSIRGIGEVYDNKQLVARVKYNLYLYPETKIVAGNLNVTGLEISLWGHNMLTLNLDDNRKLNFFVSEANGNGYQIQGHGMFY